MRQIASGERGRSLAITAIVIGAIGVLVALGVLLATARRPQGYPALAAEESRQRGSHW